MISLTVERLSAQIRAVRNKYPDSRVIGIRTMGRWNGPSILDLGNECFDISWCASGLAVRERMAEQPADKPLIILTDRPDLDMGWDVISHLPHQKFFRPEPLAMVRDLFQARTIDARLSGKPWLVDAALELSGPQGFQPTASGMLDEESVWRIILEQRFLIPSTKPDALMLLRWSLEPRGVSAFIESAEELRAGFRDYISSSSDEIGRLVLDCVTAGHAADVVPFGLVARVLFGDERTSEKDVLREAIIRMEPVLGGHTIDSMRGRGWAKLAEALMRSLRVEDPAGADDIIVRAEALLKDAKAEAKVGRSTVLPAGFQARAAAFATDLRAATEDSDQLQCLESSGRALLDHVLCDDPARIESIHMAIRLGRWLTLSRSQANEPSFIEVCKRYCHEGSWIDRGRALLARGDENSLLSGAYQALLDKVTDRRETANLRYGQFLSQWLPAPSTVPPIILSEQVITTVVAPLSRKNKTLFLVVDGMSQPVFLELLSDIFRLGWSEFGTDQVASRMYAVAAFPTETEVARCTLFSGIITRGNASTELENFCKHPALLEVSKPSAPPALFHKSDLIAEGMAGLAEEVRRAIGGPRQVVGVVVNAVDDHLTKGEQVAVNWNVGTIRPLRELLETARAAGRIVILTSDHGHIIENRSELRENAGTAARWKPATAALETGEIRLSGSRVVSDSNEGIVALATERVRYGRKKAGYHGGATPQESIVPVAVLAPVGTSIDGWSELPVDRPLWWDDPMTAVTPAKAKIELAKTKPTRQREGDQPTLFGSPVVTEAAADTWIDCLMRSEVYANQKRFVERFGLADQQVKSFLVIMEARGLAATSPALARGLALPPFRIAGVIAALKRLFNVEGFSVLVVDAAADTVKLNRDLLLTQFGIERN